MKDWVELMYNAESEHKEIFVPLPVKTLPDDVIKIIDFLKTKATGSSVTEAKSILGGSTMDGRKLVAYSFWGFVDKQGDNLKLTSRGWEIARSKKPQSVVFQEVIDGIVPYRAAIEWAYHQKLSEVSNVDIAAFWHDNHGESIGSGGEGSIKEQAVCFFRVCIAAELGTFIVGRGGAPTRLKLALDKLHEVIKGGPTPLPISKEAEEIEDVVDEESENETVNFSDETTENSDQKEGTEIRVFISHGKNKELVDQVEKFLGLFDIDCEIAIKEETAAIPVPDKIFGSMRRCNAGIIIVSVDDESTDAIEYAINNNVLIEIGAAFVLYNRKVILLWDKRLQVPSNLQGLYRCEFEGNGLNWNTGMKLMKAIKDFKKDLKK